VANGYAERLIGTIRREYLDRLRRLQMKRQRRKTD
jgi:hypothetical protein